MDTSQHTLTMVLVDCISIQTIPIDYIQLCRYQSTAADMYVGNMTTKYLYDLVFILLVTRYHQVLGAVFYLVPATGRHPVTR